MPTDQHVYTIAASTSLYRLTNKGDPFGPESFNPNTQFVWRDDEPFQHRKAFGLMEATNRFSPFRSGNVVVPTLYVAETQGAAIQEAIFRPNSTNAARTVHLGKLDKNLLNHLQCDADLRLARIDEIFMQGGSHEVFPFNFDDLTSPLTETSAKAGRTFAQYIHSQYPQLDGICWESVRYSNNMSIMLWNAKGSISCLATSVVGHLESLWKPMVTKLLNEGRLNIDPSKDSIGRL